jgi:hypothetical protein
MRDFFRELAAMISRPLGPRFHIRDLMLWTAVVALMMGFYKLEHWLGRYVWILPASTAVFAVCLLLLLLFRRAK